MENVNELEIIFKFLNDNKNIFTVEELLQIVTNEINQHEHPCEYTNTYWINDEGSVKQYYFFKKSTRNYINYCYIDINNYSHVKFVSDVIMEVNKLNDFTKNLHRIRKVLFDDTLNYYFPNIKINEKE